MELKNKPKAFDAVGFMREQRKIISEKLSNMTRDEIVDYFKKQEESAKVRIRPSA